MEQLFLCLDCRVEILADSQPAECPACGARTPVAANSEKPQTFRHWPIVSENERLLRDLGVLDDLRRPVLV